MRDSNLKDEKQIKLSNAKILDQKEKIQKFAVFLKEEKARQQKKKKEGEVPKSLG
jgi:hypothetical protein